MARAAQVDGMLVGEPEDAIVALASLDQLAPDRLDAIPSLTYRLDESTIVPHKAQGVFTGFANMPFPAWDLVPLAQYTLPLEGKPYIIVETSRGCPYSCDFCVAPIHQGHKFRERDAKSIVDEIERATKELGVRHFYLWADTVTLNAKSFGKFCDELIARKLDIRWFGNARADNLTDLNFVKRLRASGCWMLAMGIESASDETRKDMVKKLEEKKIELAFKHLRQTGIKSFAFFIFGYPGESVKTMEQTTRVCDQPGSGLREFLSGGAVSRHGALRQEREGRPARARGLVAHGVFVLPAAGQRPERRSGDERDQSREAALLPAAEIHRAPHGRRDPAADHETACGERRHHQVPVRRRDDRRHSAGSGQSQPGRPAAHLALRRGGQRSGAR